MSSCSCVEDEEEVSLELGPLGVQLLYGEDYVLYFVREWIDPDAFVREVRNSFLDAIRSGEVRHGYGVLTEKETDAGGRLLTFADPAPGRFKVTYWTHA